MSIAGGDDKGVPYSGVREIGEPSWPWVDIGLGPSRRGGALLLVLEPSRCLDCSFVVELGQRAHRNVKEGRRGGGERRERRGTRGGRIGGDWVSWGHWFAVRANDIVREVREGRRNGKRRGEGLGLDFPVIV